MNTNIWPIDARLRYWHPVAPVHEIGNKPAAFQCCGVPIVMYANGGDVVALYDRCAHRRMPLSHGKVSAEGITCAYHSCRFAADGAGYCPATKSNRFSVPVFETRTMFGVIWVRSRDAAERCGEDPGADLGLSPDLIEDDHRFSCVVFKNIAAPVQLVVDNMTELEHTATVHRQLAFGIAELDGVETRCEPDAEGVTIFYRGRQRPLPRYLTALSGLRDGDLYLQTACVSFTPPCASYRIWWTDGLHGETRAFGLRFVNYYTEIDRGHTRLFSFVYQKTAGTPLDMLPQIAVPLFRRIVSVELDRDKEIIEKMPAAEASLQWFQLNRFDRPLVVTRKLMQRHYSDDAAGAGDRPANQLRSAQLSIKL